MLLAAHNGCIGGQKLTRSKQESIYKRADGRWVAVLELPTRGGKRRRRYLYAATEKDVKQRLKTERRTLEERGDLSTASPSVETWFTYWVNQIAPERVRPTTLAGYRNVINHHVIPEIGKRKLAKLTADDIRAVHARILATPKSKSNPDGPKLNSTSALLAHRVMSRALKVAEREGKIGRNPCELMDAPRKAAQKLEALDVDEAKAVLRLVAQAIDAPGVYDPRPALYAYLLLSASRRGEALGLQWDRVSSHLDVSRQLQRITNADSIPADYEMEHLGGTFYLVPVKTESGNRIIPLVDPLKTILELHSQRAGVSPQQLVFCHEDGSPFDPDSITAGWQRWLVRTGVTTKHVRLHDLRHTTVDLLYEAGVPEDLIVQIVGHSTRMQSRAYKSQRADPRLTSAMEALSSLLA